MWVGCYETLFVRRKSFSLVTTPRHLFLEQYFSSNCYRQSNEFGQVFCEGSCGKLLNSWCPAPNNGNTKSNQTTLGAQIWAGQGVGPEEVAGDKGQTTHANSYAFSQLHQPHLRAEERLRASSRCSPPPTPRVWIQTQAGNLRGSTDALISV